MSCEIQTLNLLDDQSKYTDQLEKLVDAVSVDLDFDQLRGNQFSENTCSECLIPFAPGKLMSCSRCKTVKYCGRKCQVNAWKSHHKTMCGVTKVIPIKDNGLGIAATRTVKKGELVFKEKPIITFSCDSLRNALKDLPGVEKRKLMSLSDPTPDNSGTLGQKIKTNVFYGIPNANVYHMMSRINHSCLANVRVVDEASDSTQYTTVYAIKTIPEGEELTLDYIAEESPFCPQQMRNKRLKEKCGFNQCLCVMCKMTGRWREESDNNRQNLRAFHNMFEVYMMTLHRDYGFISGCRIVSILRPLLATTRDLLVKEGLDNDGNMLKLAYNALKISCSQSDIEIYKREAIAFAKAWGAKNAIRHLANYKPDSSVMSILRKDDFELELENAEDGFRVFETDVRSGFPREFADIAVREMRKHIEEAKRSPASWSQRP